MVSSARLCLMCKGGRNLCGHSPCPLIPRFDMEKRLRGRIGRDFFGPSYSIFVGRYGYPRVNVGPMVAVEEKQGLDSPNTWLNMGYNDIVELRSLLLRSKQREPVHSKSRFVRESQELVLASRPTDVEMNFKKDPVYRVSFSDVVQPMGPSALLDRMRVTENVHVPRKVDKIVSDDLRAGQAGFELYSSGQDVYKISAILSSGVLGLEKNRKMVPTRWGITASDEIITKELMKKVRDYPSINDYLVFESQHLDNHFVVLMMPGSWEFENFEAWAPGSMWSQNLKKTEIIEEHEPFKGRTKYADKQGGGYYASRIACVEKLHEMRRQARVVVFREVHEGYVIPLGVWVVRQTARTAYKNPPKRFATKVEALEYVDSRTRIPVSDYRKQSRVLGRKTLLDF